MSTRSKVRRPPLPIAPSAGVLPSQHIRRLWKEGRIRSTVDPTDDQVQPASIDLRLGPRAYRVQASFLPGAAATVMDKVRQFRMHALDLTEPQVFERGCMYIVPLLEELALPPDLSARANPKSTTGRLDVFTRLITDGGPEFEAVRPGYTGKLYAEIAPRTFSIVVRQGTKLNQLRFIRGDARRTDRALLELHGREALVYGDDDAPGRPRISDGLWVSIDLKGAPSADVIGYKARTNTPVLDLSKVEYYDPLDFWEPIHRTPSGTIILNPGDFYILTSKEKVSVRPDHAAAMVPYDPSVGEFRIHYAGFFDPGFGYGAGDIKGTRAVLEVRSHEVPFLFEDGQIVGRLMYEALVEKPEKVYGPSIGSSYQSQGLALSKQFKRPPR